MTHSSRWIVSLGALLLCLESSAACAASPIAPGDSLQAAIDAAAPGTTIDLEARTYTGSVVIDRSVTLRGVGDATVIEGDRAGAAMLVRGVGIVVSIQRLTVLGGQGWNGHGIEIQGSPLVDLLGVTARGNEWAGIWATDRSVLRLAECRLIENGTIGLFTWDFARVTLEACHMSRNKTYGILALHLSEIGLADCVVSSNVLGISAWDGVRIHGESTTVSDSALIGLEGQNGALLELDSCSIVRNSLCGLSLSDSSRGVLRSCVVASNEGDGIFLERDGIGEFRDCVVTSNGGFGIRAATATCTGQFDPSAPYKGWVEGAGNRAPSPGEPEANARGGLCPVYPGSIWPVGFIATP